MLFRSTTIYRYSSSGPTAWFLYNGTKVAASTTNCGGTPLASGTFASGQLSATVLSGNGLLLNAQQNYTILTNGSSYSMRYGTSGDNPVAGSTGIVYWIGGVSDVSQDAYIRNVWGIGFNPLVTSSLAYVDGHGKALSNSATSSACAGEVFTLANTSILTTVYRYTNDTATSWFIYNGTKTADSPSTCGGTPIASGSFFPGQLAGPIVSGIQLGIVLNQNQNYTFLTSGTNYQMKYGASNDNPTPGNTSLVEWVAGISDVSQDNYIRNVRGLRLVVGGQPVVVVAPVVDSHGRALSNAATSSACAGEVFNLTRPVNVTTVYRYSTDTADSWFLYNGTTVASSDGVCGGTPLASGTFGGGQVASPVLVGESVGVVLNGGQNYTLLTSGSQYQMRYGGSTDNPVVGNSSIVTWLAGISDTSQDSYVRNVRGIGFRQLPTLDTHNKPLNNSAESDACAGIVFNLSEPAKLTTVVRYSSLTATMWFLYNGTKVADSANICGGTFLGSGTFVGTNTSATVMNGAGIVLNAQQNYTLLTSGTDYEMHYGSSADAPVIGTTGIVTWIKGVSDTSKDGYIRNLQGIGLEGTG